MAKGPFGIIELSPEDVSVLGIMSGKQPTPVDVGVQIITRLAGSIGYTVATNAVGDVFKFFRR